VERVFAPTGTPPAVVDKLAAAIRKVTQDPAFRKKLEDQGSTPVGNTPAEFKKVVDEEIDKSAKLVKLSGAKVE
jgi:tripartite-type tricarboxylate transporter receptor subunit TctC